MSNEEIQKEKDKRESELKQENEANLTISEVLRFLIQEFRETKTEIREIKKDIDEIKHNLLYKQIINQKKELTKKEMGVSQRLDAGKDIEQIAEEMGLKKQSVKV